MNKITSLLLTVAFIVPMVTNAEQIGNENTYSAKEMKEFQKEAEKTAKNRMKQFKKEKWDFNGSGMLETKLKRHYAKLEDFGGTCEERIGDKEAAGSISIGEKMARSAVTEDYTREIREMIEGTVDTHSSHKNDNENDIYIDNWTSKAVQEIQGDIQKSFTIYKKNNDGTYHVRVYFLLDKRNSLAAQKRALEGLANDIKNDNELSDAIRKAAKDLDNE